MKLPDRIPAEFTLQEALVTNPEGTELKSPGQTPDEIAAA
jgi:hypothetical protein